MHSINQHTLAVAENADWNQIKLSFIEGVDYYGKKLLPSTVELARAHNIPPSLLQERIAKEGWKKDRDEYQKQVRTLVHEQKPQELATLAIDADVAATEAGVKALKIVQNEVGALQKERESLRGQELEKFRGRLPGRLMALMAAAVNAQKLVKLVIGEPTDNQGVKHTFELGRMAQEAAIAIMERERQNAEVNVTESVAEDLKIDVNNNPLGNGDQSTA